MKKGLIVFIIVFFNSLLFSQNNWIKEIDMDTSVVYSTLSVPTDVVVENNGTIWSSFKLAASGGYITSYFNNIYTCYSADSLNLPATDVRDLCIYDNTIYAATDSGILKFNGSNWEVFLNESSGLHSNYVYGFDIKNNKIYARTDTVINIYNISTQTFSYVQLPTSYNNWENIDIKRAVYVDDNDNLYVGDTNCVYLINGTNIIDVYYNNYINYDYYIYDIKKTNSGQLYALSSNNVYRLINNELVDVMETMNIEYTGMNLFFDLYNMFVDGDTIFIASYDIIKITDDYESKTYSYPSPHPFVTSIQGVLFKDINGDLCIKNKGDYYKKLNLFLYGYLTEANDDNYKYLDINNINAGFRQNGILFNNKKSDYEIPKGTGKYSLYTSSLWITAFDEDSIIHSAANLYNTDGFDYFPGPLNNDGETDSTISNQYNKVWKINRLDIEEMRYRYENGMINQVGYQIPEDILTWPANGNTSLGYSQNLAPYFDANGDNIYDVYAGDYPLIHGDQEIFSVFNDNTSSEHLETKGQALKFEIQNSFYAYTCPNGTDSTSEINNVSYLYYKIINKSNKTYYNTYIGLFADADIGDASNDLVGTNVDLKSFYFYNYGADGDGSGNTYGENPPSIAYTFLNGVTADNADNIDNNNNGTIDEISETCDFNNFLSFLYNGGATYGDPIYAEDYSNFMQSKWKDGTHQKYDITSIDADFGYPGNSDSNNYGTGGVDPGYYWFDTQAGDKRGIGSIGPFTFEPSDTVEFTVAIVWSRDTTDTVDIDNVQKLFSDIENVRYWYDNNIDLSCLELDTSSIGISTVKPNINFEIYPNPVKDNLFLEFADYKNSKYRITDINGRILLEAEIINNRTAINTKDLAKGVYIITIYKDDSVLSKKFVK